MTHLTLSTTFLFLIRASALEARNSFLPRKLLGNKFQRAVTSEIVGIQAEKGVRTSSRIDPLGITKAAEVFKTQDGDWTLEQSRAETNAKGEPLKAKPADFIHGNIPPDLSRYNPKQYRGPLKTMYEKIERGDVLPGGVTVDYAVQTTVLSLPALRRLRFPVDGNETPERNNAARTLLAALALSAITYIREHGYDLRSRCLLIPEGDAVFELLANNGKAESFQLTSDLSRNLFEDAVNQATANGVPWQTEIINLTPEARLVEWVRKSREVAETEEE